MNLCKADDPSLRFRFSCLSILLLLLFIRLINSIKKKMVYVVVVISARFYLPISSHLQFVVRRIFALFEDFIKQKKRRRRKKTKRHESMNMHFYLLLLITSKTSEVIVVFFFSSEFQSSSEFTFDSLSEIYITRFRRRAHISQTNSFVSQEHDEAQATSTRIRTKTNTIHFDIFPQSGYITLHVPWQTKIDR